MTQILILFMVCISCIDTMPGAYSAPNIDRDLNDTLPDFTLRDMKNGFDHSQHPLNLRPDNANFY